MGKPKKQQDLKPDIILGNYWRDNARFADLFNLFEILLNQDSSTKEIKQRAIEYAKEHEVEKEVVMTAAGAVNCRLDYNALGGRKDEVNMIRVFEAERMEGRIEGTIKMLKRYKESSARIVEELISEFNISRDTAEEYLDKFNKGEL